MDGKNDNFSGPLYQKTTVTNINRLKAQVYYEIWIFYCLQCHQISQITTK
jgi:hypothetical protein